MEQITLKKNKSKKVIKEQMVNEALIKTDTMGVNSIGIIRKGASQRVSMLSDSPTYKNTLDYIFGFQEENPLESVTSEVEEVLNNYSNRTNVLADNILKLA